MGQALCRLQGTLQGFYTSTLRVIVFFWKFVGRVGLRVLDPYAAYAACVAGCRHWR